MRTDEQDGSILLDPLTQQPMPIGIPADYEREQQRMTDIWDSPKWRARVIDNGFLSASQPLNLLIQLSSDGVNPFGQQNNYSMWPIYSSVLNYPPALRNKFNKLWLLGIVSGPNKPKTMTAYMRHIVQQFNELYDTGLHIPIVSQTYQQRRVKVQLLQLVADYPALGLLLNQQTVAAAHGCITCHIVGKHSAACHAMLYTGHSRWKHQSTTPALRTQEELLAAAIEADRANDQGIDVGSESHPVKITGKLGSSGLDDLWFPDQNRGFEPDMAPPDPMHQLMANTKRFITLFKGKTDKKTKGKKASGRATEEEDDDGR